MEMLLLTETAIMVIMAIARGKEESNEKKSYYIS